MASVPNGVETVRKILIAWVGCTNVIDRQTDDRQTDGRPMTYNDIILWTSSSFDREFLELHFPNF